ncbi:MAG: DUF1292 domain-containing protein [Oscillospiraceae bacterium]|nr:DUF1292 domain-containing protein [Oscillospiraceae bacterium]
MDKNVIFTLEDDLGNEIEFELLDVITYKNEEYAVLIENTEDVDELTILKIESYDDEEEVYSGIDDDALVHKIFDIFKKNHPDDFNYSE